MSVVGIFGKAKHRELEALIKALVQICDREKWHPVCELGLSEYTQQVELLLSEEIAKCADLVVVLGGDGTLIRVARLLDKRAVPIFGVNMGHLGFLTAFTADEAEIEFRKVLAGDFEVERRITLYAQLIRHNNVCVRSRVLNDVVVSVGEISRIASIRVEVNSTYVSTFRADGLIVSTPSGSTAYNIAAGGPILMPGTRTIVLTPICPHILTNRSLVLQDNVHISIDIGECEHSMYVTFDGQSVERMEPKDRINITRASGYVLLVKPPRDNFHILRTKLKWGQP